MVVADATRAYMNVQLLSTQNHAFPQLLTQILKLQSLYPENPIKTIRFDSAGEFTSTTFEQFCASAGITQESTVPHVHTQNGLAEAIIKSLQVIARPMLLQTNLPAFAWGLAIVHAGTLLSYRPSSMSKASTP